MNKGSWLLAVVLAAAATAFAATPSGDVVLAVKAPDGWQIKAALAPANAGAPVTASSGEKIKFPAGVYTLLTVMANSGTKEGGSSKAPAPIALSGGWPKGMSLELKAGETAMPLGPPLRFEVLISKSLDDDADVEIGEVALVGVGGERYHAWNFAEGAKNRLLWFARAGEAVTQPVSLTYSQDGLLHGGCWRIPDELADTGLAEVVVRFESKELGTFEVVNRLAKLPAQKPALAGRFQKAMDLYAEHKDEPGTVQAFEHLASLYPADPRVLNMTAWVLLTARNENLRAPKRALALAREAARLSQEKRGNILDTLALALHENGLLEDAARYAKRAAELDASEDIVKRAKDYAKDWEKHKKK